jgi:excisionase family DNA binding protein
MGVIAVGRSSVLAHATRVEPQPDDQETTSRVSHLTADSVELVLRQGDGTEIPLPRSLVAVLLASAEELSEGHAVTVLASEVRLTPAEVGELLGLSRPFVVRLLDGGEIPSEHLPDSRHRVVRLVDVLKFQARRERRNAGRRRVAEAVETAELPY